ncbi:MAG: CoA activase [Deltaproteobacteria bacterium]|nr:CoA activase [Deltaproteobacteria bacterium]
MENCNVLNFESFGSKVGRFSLKERTVLIPEMNRMGTHLLAANFRSFGIRAKILETFEGMDLGMAHTSGKECFPCQITMGDILHFMSQESARLGSEFDSDAYVYFLPEADGPCRFGMYNKYQRIVLDSFPGFSGLRIGALTTADGYSLDGIIETERVTDLRKSSYVAMVVGDILDRLLWRVRPYEKEAQTADLVMDKCLAFMVDAFERFGQGLRFDEIFARLEAVTEEAKGVMDPKIPPKPLIGMVGEIYLRTHVKANQDVIRMLEKHGAEVVNASVAEWVNYTSYDRYRSAKTALRFSLKQLKFDRFKDHLKDLFTYGGDLFYQEHRQRQIYKRISGLIDLAKDHKVSHLESVLREQDLYSFDLGTEACLSIAGMMEYVREGYNGLVNVYPFTCMPSITTSSIVRPLMNRLRVPYLDTPYDSSTQPGRESAIRTFMYQADQHLKRYGRHGS